MKKKFIIWEGILIIVLMIIAWPMMAEEDAIIHWGEIGNDNQDGVTVTLQMDRYPTAQELSQLSNGTLMANSIQGMIATDVLEFETAYHESTWKMLAQYLNDYGFVVMKECNNLDDCNKAAKNKCGSSVNIADFQYNQSGMTCSFTCNGMASYVYVCAEKPKLPKIE